MKIYSSEYYCSSFAPEKLKKFIGRDIWILVDIIDFDNIEPKYMYPDYRMYWVQLLEEFEEPPFGTPKYRLRMYSSRSSEAADKGVGALSDKDFYKKRMNFIMNRIWTIPVCDIKLPVNFEVCTTSELFNVDTIEE